MSASNDQVVSEHGGEEELRERTGLAESDIRSWTTGVLVLIAVIFRAILFLRNRSLWLDEAQLALNLIERSYLRLLKPLAYGQGAPVGFLWLQKVVGSIGQYDEHALRLVPLVAGIAVLYVVWRLAQLVNEPNVYPVAVALVAFSPFCVYFSCELKQYSTDVFFCTLVLLMFFRYVSGTATLKSVLVAGSLALWFSHPAAFVVFGAITILLLRAHRLKQYQQRSQALRAFLAFAVNFAILYAVSLRSLSRHGYLLAAWAADFMPRLPHTSAELRWFSDHYFGFFRNPFAITAYGGGVLFAVGCVALYRRRRFVFLLLVSPFGPLLLACFLHKYPLSGRLVLFLVPVAAILIAEGIGAIAALAGFLVRPLRGRESIIVAILLIAILIEPGRALARLFLLPGGGNVEETRQVLDYVGVHSRGDELWYVDCVAKPAFLYYSHLGHIEHENVELPIDCTPDCLRGDVARMYGKRVWLITSLMPSVVLVKGGSPTAFSSQEVLTSALDKAGPRLDGIHIPSGTSFYFGSDMGTSAYLYDLRQVAPVLLPRQSGTCGPSK